MIETWRWFGPNDPIPLRYVAQAGASGIVTALHHVPVGAVWPVDDIAARKKEIEASGLTWSVCESIPTPDAIKLKGRAAIDEIAVWKETLVNLGRCGIKTVCYNFMPVLDWTRTNLKFQLRHGGRALRFDWVDLVAFDAFVLERSGALEGVPTVLAHAAEDVARSWNDAQKKTLEETILAGLPGGAAGQSKEQFLETVAQFDGVTADIMRQHLAEFLHEICPVADEFDMKLAIHPDDPPFSIFGLPRIVSTKSDAMALLDMNSSPSNGLTFCTGSYGARSDNDLSAFVRAVAKRVHFAHLRNVRIEKEKTFQEANHLNGSADMVDILSVLLGAEEEGHQIPMRPDHGHALASDIGSGGNPGYTYIGRLKGLAELRGIISALRHQSVQVAS